jgi:hypothetical protein
MNNTHPDKIALATQRHVITSCDYETCPTIKSNNGSNTIIVVRSDEMLHSIEAGRNHGDDNHYKPLENRTVGVLLQ